MEKFDMEAAFKRVQQSDAKLNIINNKLGKGPTSRTPFSRKITASASKPKKSKRLLSTINVNADRMLKKADQ
jgi:hypothetical protein